MEKISVIIPNWNGLNYLKICFDSLLAQTYQDFAVYLVDNGSEDDSIVFVKSNYPNINIIGLTENLGFSAAINAGINASKGELIVALNNDTEADPKWLEEIASVMDNRHDIGFCASLLLDFSDRTVIDSFGDNYSFFGLSGKIASGKNHLNIEDHPVEVFSACAAGSGYRRNMLDKIGLFDEDFFCYMEDVDIGIRAQLAGYRCLAIPSAKVFHIGSASTGGDMSAFSLKMTAKNLFLVIIKDMPLPLLMVMLPLSLAGQLWLVIESLFFNSRPKFKKHLDAYFIGLKEGIRLMPVILKKRKLVQSTRTISAYQMAKLIYKSRAQNIAYRLIS